MKYLLTGLLLLVVFAASGVGFASAQDGDRRLSTTPKAFQVFYTRFRKAVIARDKVTVASLTRFPFDYGFDAGDKGTYSRKQVLKNFDNIFGLGRENMAIFRRTNPTFYAGQGRFELVDESDASHYIFEKSGVSYKFTAFIAEA